MVRKETKRKRGRGCHRARGTDTGAHVLDDSVEVVNLLLGLGGGGVHGGNVDLRWCKRISYMLILFICHILTQDFKPTYSLLLLLGLAFLGTEGLGPAEELLELGGLVALVEDSNGGP